MEARHIEHPFPPVVCPGCRVLILGSVPSVRSCEEGFYYMHPQNRFWPMLSKVFGADFTGADSDEKRAMLLQRRIALYDSVYSCDIVGSGDSSVTNAVPADIPALMRTCGAGVILANGARAYRELIRPYPEYAGNAVKLPSTSPANAAYSLERLVGIWAEALLRAGVALPG